MPEDGAILKGEGWWSGVSAACALCVGGRVGEWAVIGGVPNRRQARDGDASGSA